jgi:hypothetical protein
VAERLGRLPSDNGITDVTAVLVAVNGFGHEGWPVPTPIARVVRRATAGAVEELIAAGVIGSAEVLTRLTGRLAAATAASAYPDEALRILMGATHRAFRNRRSLLLLNLDHQVRLGELPWAEELAADIFMGRFPQVSRRRRARGRFAGRLGLRALLRHRLCGDH